jgi:hypothetical protein
MQNARSVSGGERHEPAGAVQQPNPPVGLFGDISAARRLTPLLRGEIAPMCDVGEPLGSLPDSRVVRQQLAAPDEA